VAQFEDITAPTYLEGLLEWRIERVRSTREEVRVMETDLSFSRRFVQGRLDILRVERGRRAAREPPMMLEDLISRLPQILGDKVHAPGHGQLPVLMSPGSLAPKLEAQVEVAFPAAELDSLPDIDDAELAASIERLEGLEHSVSSQRKAVQDVEDRLKAELVRRYSSGEATVDSLFR
jgi:hypothetical protein